jgi:hypothetical protein
MNYNEYKKAWWNFLRKENRNKTYFTLLKFRSVYTSMRGLYHVWLSDWWRDFDINKSAVDPTYLNIECTAKDIPLREICDLFESDRITDDMILSMYATHHLQWLVKTRISAQSFQG